MLILLFNRIVNVIFDILFLPFRSLPPVWGLIFISILTGVMMLVMFKALSNQERIRETKERMKAHLLELYLYRDDIRLSLIGLKDLFLRNLHYLFLMFKPMIIIIPPTMIILIQLAARFENRPFEPGEQAIVSVRLDESANLKDVKLVSDDGIDVETAPLRLEDERRIYWRIQAKRAGLWSLHWRYGSQAEIVEHDVVVGQPVPKLDSRRSKMSALQSFLNPVSRGLERKTFIRQIHVRYPAKQLRFLGIQMHWLIIFFIVSLIAAFTLKGLFGVVI